MNVDLLREVADYIEAHPDEFQMTWFAERTECGTACCIAGATFALKVRPFRPRDFDQDGMLRHTVEERVRAEAGVLLGLSDGDADRIKWWDTPADRLFSDAEWWGRTLRSLGFRRDLLDDDGSPYIFLHSITPRHAVKVLRALADGRVSL